MYVVETQPEFTAAMAAYPYSGALEGKFKFISRFGDAVSMCYKEGAYLYVPRECVPLGKVDYRQYSNTPIAIDCNFEPRNEEQATLPFKSLELLKAGFNHIFQAPTGWGKSVGGGVIACLLGQPTMIVVNKEDLMDSWYDAIVNVLGVPPSMVGKVQQDTCNWQGKRIVIGMAHSLCKEDRYPDEMYRYFGFLIVDEVHQMAPEFFAAIFRKFPAKYRLGFSATTDRSDGKWKILTYNIGPVAVVGRLVPMVAKILVKQTGWKIPRVPIWRNGEKIIEPIPHSPGRMTLVHKAMGENQARNMEIVEFTKAAYSADRVTLIVCELKDHLTRLFQMLTSNGIPGEDISYYVGGLKQHERETAKKARVVLATYKMVMTGTNVPHWDSLAFGTPRADIRQTLGRILRFMSGKKQPVALDLLDYDKILQGFYMSRLAQYYAVGAQVVQLS
jgi:superfamily II DNA or RNA helicase